MICTICMGSKMWPVGCREQEALSKNEIPGVGVGVRKDEMEINLVERQERGPEGGKKEV